MLIADIAETLMQRVWFGAFRGDTPAIANHSFVSTILRINDTR